MQQTILTFLDNIVVIAHCAISTVMAMEIILLLLRKVKYQKSQCTKNKETAVTYCYKFMQPNYHFNWEHNNSWKINEQILLGLYYLRVSTKVVYNFYFITLHYIMNKCLHHRCLKVVHSMKTYMMML